MVTSNQPIYFGDRMIISLSGNKRCGKDTVANFLVKQFSFKKIALADPLREICSKVFEIPLSTFLDDELKEKAFQYPVSLTESDLGHIEAIIENEWGFNLTDYQHSAMLEHVGVTFAHPRQILQYVGTELIRGCIDDNIFLKLADKRITSTDANVVLSDVRFKVERDWAKSKGALMCLINRPSKVKVDTHVSENDLGDESEYTTVMTNDGTLSGFICDIHTYFNVIVNRRSY
jgi:hypothetical protein